MIFGLYTKKEYEDAIAISKMHGYREGAADIREEAGNQIAAIQETANKYKYENQEIREIKTNEIMNEVNHLKNIRDRVKSPKKKKKLRNRIIKETLKLIELNK